MLSESSCCIGMLSILLGFLLIVLVSVALFHYPNKKRAKEMQYDLEEELEQWKPHKKTEKHVDYWEEKQPQ